MEKEKRFKVGDKSIFDKMASLSEPTEPKQESVFENAKSTLREHLFDNKEKVARDLEQMHEWSNANKQETLEEAVNNFKKTDVYVNKIKQEQERMYNEEEVTQLLIKFNQEIQEVEDVREWFEQFKKK